MSDPRFTDPQYSNDDRMGDPVLRRDESIGGVWAWIAGLAALALIAFVVIAGWNSDGSNTASNSPAPSSAPMSTTGSSAPMRSPATPSTTGSGAASPMTPAPAAPAAPAPANSGAK